MCINVRVCVYTIIKPKCFMKYKKKYILKLLYVFTTGFDKTLSSGIKRKKNTITFMHYFTS